MSSPARDHTFTSFVTAMQVIEAIHQAGKMRLPGRKKTAGDEVKGMVVKGMEGEKKLQGWRR